MANLADDTQHNGWERDNLQHAKFLSRLTLKELIEEAEMFEIELPPNPKKAEVLNLLIANL